MSVLIPLAIFLLFCVVLVVALALCTAADRGDRMLSEAARADVDERRAARDLRVQRTVDAVPLYTRGEDER